MSDTTFDPYARTPDEVSDPPETLGAIVKEIGPGLVLAGSIVGTGELIATTVLGLKAGFALLWLVLISCFIKVFAQVELGRYALSSGKTTMAGLQEVPKVGSVLSWWWFIMMLATQLQIGAMIGGSGYAIFKGLDLYVFPTESYLFSEKTWVHIWMVIVTLITIGLLVTGSYKLIERFCTSLVGIFTLLTIVCVILLQSTNKAITAEQIGYGLSFTIPTTAALVAAFTMIGITGVGSSELVAYPYWCLEKGYARHVGPREDSEAWTRRAKGWMRVMQVDAWLSMVVYTISTLAFYLLGAALLHDEANQQVPGNVEEMISRLSGMYSVLGAEYAIPVILIGAFIVLYSTLFSATAGNSRITADFLHTQGMVKLKDHQDRLKWIRILGVVFPCLGFALFMSLKDPIYMVTIGGVSQAITLPMLAGVAIFLRYRRTDQRIAPNQIWTVLLWVSLVAFTIAAAHGLYSSISKVLSTITK